MRTTMSNGENELLPRSMRKLLDESSVAQSLDGERLMGSLHVPEEISSSSTARMQ
jgi:hypothetical protein